jgi:hypothetical protein
VENQHRLITGYRELSPYEIELMNEIKAKGEELGALVQKLETYHYTDEHGAVTPDRPDLRWVAIGKTQLQQGLMALTRAVAKPTTF